MRYLSNASSGRMGYAG
ncbi:MAG: hypothetical protein R3C11_21870 [Planctomycetaceae bacterium]